MASPLGLKATAVLMLVLASGLVAGSATAAADPPDRGERREGAHPDESTADGPAAGALPLIGQADVRREVSLSSAEQVSDDESAGFTAAQQGGSSVAGTVTNRQGHPLDGICAAAVVGPLARIEPVSVVVTGVDGSYRLDLDPDAYRLAFVDCKEDVGYGYAYWPNQPSFTSAALVDVPADIQLTGYDVVLEPASIISGQVSEQDTGAAIGDACAAVFEATGELLAAPLTDTEGRYSLTGLREASYFVGFVDCSDQPVYAWQWWQERVSPVDATPVVLEAGEHRSGIEASLARAGGITGRVTAEETGQAVEGACAVLFDASGTHLHGGLTAADGTYEIEGIPPGSYRLLFADCMELGRFGERWYGGQSLETAGPVSVQADATTAGIDVALPPSDLSEPDPVSPSDPPPSDPPEERGACEGRDVPSAQFIDTAGNTHEAAIDCVAWLGVARGVSDDHYAPRREVTRAQMASFVARAIEVAGADLPSADDQFTDTEGNTHEDNINRLAVAGVVQGRGDGRYLPAATVTRAQMASFLARAYEYVNGGPLPPGESAFDDIDGSVHADNIERIASAGFTHGTTPTTYSPGADVRRDQMASFLARMLERFARDGILIEAGASQTVQAAANIFLPALRCFDGYVHVDHGVQTNQWTSAGAYRVFFFRWNGQAGRWDLLASAPSGGAFILDPNQMYIPTTERYGPVNLFSDYYAAGVQRWNLTYRGWEYLGFETAWYRDILGRPVRTYCGGAI